ncbi:MAG TPA: glycosyl hydrolase family 28-related protein [Candidatus Dojkabacteria bacterium]|nr:glycosyl hydrolase family 28-related protein [Candidatus Dojkabacteria bacterium]
MKKIFTILSVLLLITIFIVVYVVLKQNLAPDDQSAATVTPAELKNIGLFDVTTYGADKTGVKDSTIAIQNAIDDAYRKDAVTYFPPGTYLISDTLVALKDRAGEVGGSFHLMGSTSASELPTIKLKSGSINDNNANNDRTHNGTDKEAMIHMWACDFVEKADVGKTQCDPPYNDQLADVNKTNGNTAMLIGNSIQNLKLVMESNNPDAIGIRMTGNQRNALSNIVIESVDSFAGIYGSIGTNSTNQDITIIGGKYGVYGSYGGWGAYTNVVLKNQQVLAFTSHRGPAVSLNGFEIIKDSAPVIGEAEGVNYNDSGTYHMGSYTLSDGTIEIRNNSNKPAISTLQGRQMAVQNVTIKNAENIIQTEDKTHMGSSTAWARVNLFANTMPNVGVKLVEGATTPSDYYDDNTSISLGVNAPDAYKIRMRHGIEDGRVPSADVLLSRSKTPGSGVVNVVDRGITPLSNPLPDSAPDYSEKLNQLFADKSIKYVFVPSGVYPIKNTITLGSNTHLIGVVPNFSEIKVHPLWKPGKRVDALRTVNDANATTAMANIEIVIDASRGNNYFDAIHWEAGKNSIIYFAHTDTFGAMGPSKCRTADLQYGNERNDYHFTGNGGGRVWGTTSGGGGCSKYHEKFRGFLVNGTTQPLTLYGINPEDGHGDAINQREGFQAEIRNAKNVSVRSHKSEDGNSLLVKNSENIFILNPGGSVEWALRDNKNITVLNTVSKFIKWTNKTTGAQTVKDMIEEEINGNITAKFRSDQAVSIIKRGEVDFNVWSMDTTTPPPVTNSVTPTPDDNTSTPTPPQGTLTPTPTRTSNPSEFPSVTPTQPISGNICGKSDINGDGVFTIADFAEFARAYGIGTNTCADKDVDYGTCGGRDVNKDGKLNIADFGGAGIGFAQRYYPKTSCAL